MTNPIQETNTLNEGRVLINQHFSEADPHPLYHNDARGDARYVNETDHTKAAHDALLLDAATLDGIDSTGFVTTAAHTKAAHDALLIDAATLDGIDSTGFVTTAAHTKAAHDALNINADTLDGIDSKGFNRAGVLGSRDANVVTAITETDAPTQRFTVALTANRTITLPTTGNYNGKKYRINRTDTAAFTLAIDTLRTIPASTAEWLDVEYNGTAWVLTARGVL